MDKLARVREASMQVAKIQRRIWLVQTALPVLLIGGIVTAVTFASWVWRRRKSDIDADDVVPTSATTADPRFNSDESGNLLD